VVARAMIKLLYVPDGIGRSAGDHEHQDGP
jgi:hypothetical protein